MTALEISRKYNIGNDTVGKYAKLGVFKADKTGKFGGWNIDEASFKDWFTTKYKQKIKRNWNDKIFDRIDSPQKAYWLGMLLSDGCVKANQTIVSLDLSGADKKHIASFISFLDGESDMLYTTIHPDTGNELAHVQLCRKHFYDTLIKLGVKPQKSGKEQFIETGYNRDFLRGFFDGDGVFRKDLTEVGFVGSYEMLKKIQKIFQEEVDVEPHKIMEHGVIFRISYRNKADIYKICKYLYEDCEIALPRKYELAKKVLNK